MISKKILSAILFFIFSFSSLCGDTSCKSEYDRDCIQDIIFDQNEGGSQIKVIENNLDGQEANSINNILLADEYQKQDHEFFLFSRQFFLIVGYRVSTKQIYFTLKDQVNWILYHKTYTEKDIGKEINRKVQLYDIFKTFNQEEQNISIFQFGHEYRLNGSASTFKLEEEGFITIVTEVLIGQSRNLAKSKLNLNILKKLSQEETLIGKSQIKIRQLKNNLSIAQVQYAKNQQNKHQSYKITFLELIFNMVWKIIIIVFGIKIFIQETQKKKLGIFILLALTLLTIYMLIRDILKIAIWN